MKLSLLSLTIAATLAAIQGIATAAHAPRAVNSESFHVDIYSRWLYELPSPMDHHIDAVVAAENAANANFVASHQAFKAFHDGLMPNKIPWDNLHIKHREEGQKFEAMAKEHSKAASSPDKTALYDKVNKHKRAAWKSEAEAKAVIEQANFATRNPIGHFY